MHFLLKDNIEPTSSIIPSQDTFDYSTIKPFVDSLRSVIPLLNFKVKSGRSIIYKADNLELWSYLLQSGVFDFYSTNSSNYMIGKSQLVAFCYCGGWQAFCNGFRAPKYQIQVHHINGHTLDNRPCNLVYLSCQDHLIVSQMSFTPFYGKNRSYYPTPFNRRGKPIKDPKHYLANVILTTLCCVSMYRSGKKLDLQLSKILIGLPKQLWKTTIQWLNSPKWMTQQLILQLNPQNLCY